MYYNDYSNEINKNKMNGFINKMIKAWFEPGTLPLKIPGLSTKLWQVAYWLHSIITNKFKCSRVSFERDKNQW